MTRRPVLYGVFIALAVAAAVFACGGGDGGGGNGGFVNDGQSLYFVLNFDTDMDTSFPAGFTSAGLHRWFGPRSALAIADQTRCAMLMNISAGYFVKGSWASKRQAILQFGGVRAGRVDLRLNGGNCTSGFRSAAGQVMGRKDYTANYQVGVEINIPISSK